MSTPLPDARRRILVVAAGVAVTAGLLAGCSNQDDTASRQATVASRGAEVMPFDLEATTHTFTATTDDPTLVDAVHAWFDRQVMDHGDHATRG